MKFDHRGCMSGTEKTRGLPCIACDGGLVERKRGGFMGGHGYAYRLIPMLREAKAAKVEQSTVS